MKDLIQIEKILKKCINEYNFYQEKRFQKLNQKHPDFKLSREDFIIELEKYKRQYVSRVNIRGETEVWVNCFCVASKDWRTKVEVVDDGGNCFFNLKINLTTGRYYDLAVNGVA